MNVEVDQALDVFSTKLRHEITAACNGGDMTAARIVLFDLFPKIERPARPGKSLN